MESTIFAWEEKLDENTILIFFLALGKKTVKNVMLNAHSLAYHKQGFSSFRRRLFLDFQGDDPSHFLLPCHFVFTLCIMESTSRVR